MIPLQAPNNATILLSNVKNIQMVKVYSKALQPDTGNTLLYEIHLMINSNLLVGVYKVHVFRYGISIYI